MLLIAPLCYPVSGNYDEFTYDKGIESSVEQDGRKQNILKFCRKVIQIILLNFNNENQTLLADYACQHPKNVCVFPKLGFLPLPHKDSFLIKELPLHLPLTLLPLPLLVPENITRFDNLRLIITLVKLVISAFQSSAYQNKNLFSITDVSI